MGTAGAQAQSCSDKPIRVTTGNPASKLMNGTAQPVLDDRSKRMGQPFAVDQRTGANTCIGAEAARLTKYKPE